MSNVRFIVNENIIEGRIRRAEKLLDYTLCEGLDGKRYLIRDEEFVKEGESSEKIHTQREDVKERKKRGRPPKKI